MAGSSTLAVDASELDLSAADNVSMATSGGDESWLASSVDVDNSCRLQVPAPASGVTQHNRSSDVDDSTEDEESMSHLVCIVLISICLIIKANVSK